MWATLLYGLAQDGAPGPELGAPWANPVLLTAAGLVILGLLRRGGRTLALCLGLALALLIGEGAVRWHIGQRQDANSLDAWRRMADRAQEVGAQDALVRIIRLRDDELLQYDLAPNLARPYKGGSLRTNSVGMCEAFEYELEPPAGVFRIVGVGDSGMFGWGVPHDRNYMAVLETSLAEGAPGRYEVLNFAIPGINTRMEEEVLRQKALAYGPDLVVVGWCENDTALPNLLVKGLALRRDRSYLWLFLTDRDAFEAMLTSDFGTSTNVPEQVVAPALRASVGEEAVRDSLVRMRDLGRREGFALFVFGPMEDWLCTLLDHEGIAYASTLRLVDAAAYPEDWKVHAMHPSAEGHGVLAEVLEAELRRQGMLD